MYALEQAFFDFVSRRTLEHVDAWAESMRVPVFYLDGSLSVQENVCIAMEKIRMADQKTIALLK